MNERLPDTKAFLSYSRQTEASRRLVAALTPILRASGIAVVCDDDLHASEHITQFMDRIHGDTTITHYVVVCDPRYKRLADKRESHIGYEARLLAQLGVARPAASFIPLIAEATGDPTSVVPTFLTDLLFIDFRRGPTADAVDKLLRTLIGLEEPRGAAAPREEVSTSGTSTAPWTDDQYFATVGFLVDRGYPETALHCLLGHTSVAAADARTAIEALSIMQKFGKLKRAKDEVDRVRASSSYAAWTPSQRASLEVISLKIASQSGAHEMVLRTYEELTTRLDQSGESRFVRAVYRRAAVASASCGDHDTALSLAERALELDGVDNQLHAKETGRVFRELVLHRIGGSEPRSSATVFRSAQDGYVQAPLARELLQGAASKSAVMSLFAEAAMLLHSRARTHEGMLCLVAAHLLGQRNGSSPQAEGYSELLAAILDDDVREMVANAMRVGPDAQVEFQKNVVGSSPYLRLCARVVAVAEPGTPDGWADIRAVLGAAGGA